MNWWPIQLEKLYAQNLPMSEFVIRAKPLPASVTKDWTDEQHIERRKAEQAAIEAEWKKLGRSPSGSEGDNG